MALDLARLAPAYDVSAIAAAFAIPGPWWAGILTASTTSGPLAPLGLTAAGLLATAVFDRCGRYTTSDGQRHGLWLPRITLWTVALAGPALSAPARTAALDFLIGLHP